MVMGTLLAMFLAEVALRLTRDSNRYYPYFPGTVKVSYPNPNVTPGVSGDSYFHVNSLGCRGPDYEGQRRGLLTVGGSTTACTQLDDSETWPQLVMDAINSKSGDLHELWVTNSGIDGLTSRHHLMHAQYMLPRIEHVQQVLLYCGLNDAGGWLYAEKFDPHFLESQTNWDSTVGESFRWSCYVPASWPWYKHLELYKRASLVKNAVLSHNAEGSGDIVEDEKLQWLEQKQKERSERQKAFVPRAKVETLGAALDTYGSNLARFIELSRKAGIEPIFMPQAVQYTGLNEEQMKKLWMGALDGGHSYANEEQMQEIIARFNERMTEVAAAQHVSLIDLPREIGSHPEYYYDGCHFNELGAQKVAQIVSHFLMREVYSSQATSTGEGAAN
jgi:lysophospholipase L1-like esterase